MSVMIRKKSPRAPSMSLDEAAEKAMRIYDKESRHAVPTDIAAKHIGYKDANNGAALSALASLGYYGLVERTKDGFLTVSKDVEVYKFAPTQTMRKETAKKWLGNPAIFSDLLDKYGNTLPSDETIKFDLIQRGFSPASADACVSAFRRSVEFVEMFESEGRIEADPVTEVAFTEIPSAPIATTAPAGAINSTSVHASAPTESFSGTDRIPVRLSGGRKAWIEVPSPFFQADKARLKAHIDLLLSDDEEVAHQ